MLNQKAIDKQYLLNSLKNFDKEILSKKYLNNDMGIKGDKGEPGENGITPHIGTNGNWYIGETDTGVVAQGKEGKSITNISKDDNNNIIIIFSDGTTKNIGQLNIDIQANFLIEEGFGNLRYYQGKLEYYNASTQTWIETSVTPDNVYIFNMIPQSIKHICGIYDVEKGHYKLMFEEPDDTVIEGQVACVVEKVIICRKLGCDPTDENDGTIVTTITRPNFGTYKNDWYVDDSFTPNMGEEWYYKAFPVNTTGFANKAYDNSTGGLFAKNYYMFGFNINQSESDPFDMITYIADNKKFKNVFMDYTADKFSYGSWRDAFIIPRPCMLNTDGTVAYYLDPDDYTLSEDGTESDVTNIDFDGNTMVEFNKIYWKCVNNDDGSANYYFSDKKVDDTFKCWSNIDENGNEIDHFYCAAYDGSLHNDKMRSLSGVAPMASKNRQQELDYAHANNPDDVHIYETLTFADYQLFTLLCILISGTTDSQAAFGTGNNNSYLNESNNGVKNTGTLDNKGMFWGSQDNKSCVKVFGIENPWGNIFKACAGWVCDNGTQKIKMTYGQFDGSTVDGYNITGDGYITITDSTPEGTNGGYISSAKFTEYGIIPKQARGSSTTKYCDGIWFNNTQNTYIMVGGCSNNGASVGVFFVTFYNTFLAVNNKNGVSLSCKPLAVVQTGGES